MTPPHESKTLFIALFHLLASRNILGTDVFKTISEKVDLTIVVFTPAYKKDFLQEVYGRKNVEFIGIDEHLLVKSPGFGFFRWLALYSIPTYAMFLRAWEKIHRNKSIKNYLEYFLKRLIMLTVARLRITRKCVRFFDSTFSQVNLLDVYFNTYKPDLVFVTDVYSDADVYFLKSARKKGVPTLGMIRSWDNTVTKGLMRVIPDALIVNNQNIKEEAASIHDVHPDTVFVGGVPQFDFFFRQQFSSREEFFKKIGADPKKRLILFAPAGYILSNTDWQLCELLRKGLDEKRIPSNIQFLVRKHPGDPAILDQFVSDERFIIEWPGKKFDDRLKVTELSPEDQRHLVDSLYHADILIQVNSTIGIDSLPLDKPQIIIEFDGWEKKPYIDSVARYHDEEHMRKFLDTGAVRIVHNAEELFLWINTYLENPKCDSEHRRRAMQEQLYILDGQSGKRIGRYIYETVMAHSA